MRLLVMLLCSVLLLSCSEKRSSLLIGTNVWPGYEAFYVARDMGLYEGMELQFAELSSATDVANQMRNGNLDLAALTLDEAMKLQSSMPVPLTLVQLLDASAGADVIIAQGNKPLEQGSVIAVEHSAVGDIMLNAFIRKLGVGSEYFKVQYITIDQSVEAFNSGADAVITFEPFRTMLLDQGGVEIFSSAEIPNTIIDVLVVKESAMNESSQEQIAALIAGYYQGYEKLQQGDEKALSIAAKRLGLPAEEVLSSFAGLHIYSQQENRELLASEHGLLDEIQNQLIQDFQLRVGNKLSISAEYLP